MATSNELIVPMKVDCFVLNEDVCSPKPTDAKIAPITQPNYSYLRYDNKYLAPDILRHTDLHSTGKASSNSKIYDLGSQTRIENRIGVYVHWMLPRPYRTAATAAKPGSKGAPMKDTHLKTPLFPNIPTRWLVIRQTDLKTVQPQDAVARGLVPEFAGWVVESDHVQSIDDIGEGVDLQTDITPYINPKKSAVDRSSGGDTDKINIDKQAEFFIGSKWEAEGWQESDSREHLETMDLGQSSNQLFADFQPHNGNVLSIIDNLCYNDGGSVYRITQARVSYFVLGWHRDAASDLFSCEGTKRGEQLKVMKMALHDIGSTHVSRWSESSDRARTICHGSKYDVLWNLNKAPFMPANDFCESLMEKNRLSVGTSPLDATLAYVYAHESDEDRGMRDLAKNLQQLETLLAAPDEGVESQQAATSMIRTGNFKSHEGGRSLYFGDSSQDAVPRIGPTSIPSPPQKVPSKTERDILQQFNRAYMSLDTTERRGCNLQWDMFALWWIALSDNGENKDTSTLTSNGDNLRDQLDQVKTSLAKITIEKDNGSHTGVFNDTTGDAELGEKEREKLKALRSEVLRHAKAGVLAPFHEATEPTLLVSGVPSGWPHDFLDHLVVRIKEQLLGDFQMPNHPEKWGRFMEKMASKLPEELRGVARSLFDEFAILRSTDYIATAPHIVPLYHDREPAPNLKAHTVSDMEGAASPENEAAMGSWRDRWNSTQPFFPLYFEWEVEYIHVPFQFWEVQDTTSDPEKPSRLRYRIRKQEYLQYLEELKGKGEGPDQRTLSGRSLILPQPSFSLRSKIDALLTQLPKDKLEEVLPETTRNQMNAELQKLHFLSSPLTGLRDHLLTRLHGTHVKPNNKTPSGESIPIQMALDALPTVHQGTIDKILSRDDLARIDAASDLTPYGSLVQYSDDDNCVFKPAAHGQVRFKKLNIIDKFGQAIHAVDPSITSTAHFKTPYVSEYYTAQLLSPTAAPASTSSGHFQIPPQINQPARLNAAFVQLDHPTQDRQGSPYWRPLTEWENPVWGWVIINYANYGLQFFLPDGTFYREVRRGGPRGSLASTEWLPFPPTEEHLHDFTARQLQKLVLQLSNDEKYLEAFANVIDNCMATLLPVPAGYFGQQNVAVGRPLALANMGWSLELSTEPYATQAITGLTIPPLRLANADSTDDKDVSESNLYSFQIKFGSREKAYDALVGYFATKSDLETADPGDALDLDRFYTYYDHTQDARFKRIDDDLRPFFPFYFNPTKPGRSIDELDVLRCRRQHVFGALIDPFTSVHAYSSILPIKELRLPPWVIEKTFEKMTRFFRIGPLLLPKKVPDAKDSDQVLLTAEDNNSPGQDPKLSLPIPAPLLGTWNWLQPYPTGAAPGMPATNVDDNGHEIVTTETPQRYYTRFTLDVVDQMMRFEPGPHTTVEGFLQLRKPT